MDLQEFIKDSKTFNGFSFHGCYNMNKNHFFELFEHYIETGENLLDGYTKIMHRIWDADNSVNTRIYPDMLKEVLSEDDFHYEMSLFSNENLTQYFDDTDIFNAIKGGKDEVDNLQPLCKPCNSSKGSKHADYRF